ncbi:Alpha-actinin-like protein 1, partial [Dictyocoela muelleri]
MEEQEWVKVQTETFTNWINNKISTAGIETVRDLSVDLSDGTILAHLLMILTGMKFFFHRKPDGEFQKIENIKISLDFMKKNDIKLVNIGATDIYNGNKKLILGLIWRLILKFGVSDLHTENAQAAILSWCRATTSNYQHVNIKGFGNCWKDGMAFNAIIHKFKPELVKYDELDPKNSRENLENAFNLAEIHFGIPRLMDVDYFTNVADLDEKSVFTYVSQFYNRLVEYEKQKLQINLKDSTENIISWSIESRNNYIDSAEIFIEIANNSNKISKELEEMIENFIQKIREYYMLNSSLKNKYLDLVYLLGCINMIHKSNDLKAFIPPENLSLEALKREIDENKIDQKLKNLNENINNLLENKILTNFKNDFDPELINLLKENRKNEELENGLKKYVKSCENDYEKKLCIDKLSLVRNMNENERYREGILNDAHRLFKEIDKENKNIISRGDYLNCLTQLGIRKDKTDLNDIDYESFMLEIQNSIKPFYGVVDLEFV